MKDFEHLADAIDEHVREYVDPALAAIAKRFLEGDEAMRAEIARAVAAIPTPAPVDVDAIATRAAALVPAPADGAPGAPGKDGERGEKGERGDGVTLSDVEQLILRAVAAMPKPVDGKDAQPVDTALIVAEVLRQVPPPINGRDGADGADGAPGAPGEKGDPGQSVTAEQVAELVRSAVAEIPAPRDGKDGRDGTDGKSFSLDEVRALVDASCAAAVKAAQAEWALDFERRAHGVLERAVERMPRPKDGADGKDGRDAFNLDDLTVEHDGARKVTLKFVRGDLVKSFDLRVPAVMYRGIYQAGDTYESGDLCTFGGSLWHCNAETKDKPGEGSAPWSLCAKRGRDGKSGEPGKPGSPGRDGKDGIHGKNWDGTRGPS